MKTMHLAAAREPSGNNAGPISCLKCGTDLFHDADGIADGQGGVTNIAYERTSAEHTCDRDTYDACGSSDMPDFVKCSP